MDEKEQTRVHAALAAIPEFIGRDPSHMQVTRLGGLTNLVYRIETGGGPFVLRLPGKGTEDYIDREAELHNAIAAARAGVSPKVIHARPESGLMLTRCIEGITTMTAEGFAIRDGAASRAGQALRQLHLSGETFSSRFDLFEMIDEYLGILKAKNATLPAGYEDVVASARPVRDALASHPAPLAPCHCDPLCENFLDDGSRMWVVDWEYSGMNDPLWDLGDLSVEAGLTAAQDLELLRAWSGGDPDSAQAGRMNAYKAMCDLLWTLWGLIQHSDGNPAEDFWDYATVRFQRCKALMASPGFAAHIAAIK